MNILEFNFSRKSKTFKHNLCSKCRIFLIAISYFNHEFSLWSLSSIVRTKLLLYWNDGLYIEKYGNKYSMKLYMRTYKVAECVSNLRTSCMRLLSQHLNICINIFRTYFTNFTNFSQSMAGNKRPTNEAWNILRVIIDMCIRNFDACFDFMYII